MSTLQRAFRAVSGAPEQPLTTCGSSSAKPSQSSTVHADKPPRGTYRPSPRRWLRSKVASARARLPCPRRLDEWLGSTERLRHIALTIALLSFRKDPARWSERLPRDEARVRHVAGFAPRCEPVCSHRSSDLPGSSTKTRCAKWHAKSAQCSNIRIVAENRDRWIPRACRQSTRSQSTDRHAVASLECLCEAAGRVALWSTGLPPKGAFVRGDQESNGQFVRGLFMSCPGRTLANGARAPACRQQNQEHQNRRGTYLVRRSIKPRPADENRNGVAEGV